jgi:Excalibur calcium-binding domain
MGLAQPAAASLAMPLKRQPDSLGRPLNPGRDTINNANGVWRSLVSALVWGTRGPRFKSGHPDCIAKRFQGQRTHSPTSTPRPNDSLSTSKAASKASSAALPREACVAEQVPVGLVQHLDRGAHHPGDLEARNPGCDRERREGVPHRVRRPMLEYRLYYLNRRLDRDKDGIACEKH